jgi:hypothetical protein
MFGGEWLRRVEWDDGKTQTLRTASGIYIDCGFLGTLFERGVHALDLESTVGLIRRMIGGKDDVAYDGWARGLTIGMSILAGYRATVGKKQRTHVKTSFGAQSALLSRYDSGGSLYEPEWDDLELGSAWGPSVQLELILWGASVALRYNHLKFKDSSLGPWNLDGSTIGFFVRGYFGRMMFQGDRRSK